MRRHAIPEKQNIAMTIGEQIRQMRIEAGLSQAELCRAAGIENKSPRHYIAAIERGKQTLSIQVLEKLCAACNYDIKLIKIEK